MKRQKIAPFISRGLTVQNRGPFHEIAYVRNIRIKIITLYHTITILTTLKKKPFENILGKGENAGNQHFPPFPQCFLPFHQKTSIFESHVFGLLKKLSVWTSLKICRSVKYKGRRQGVTQV